MQLGRTTSKTHFCGGRLVDILDADENEKAIFFKNDDNMVFLGGYQSQQCDDEPDGCWVWSDGNVIAYSDWRFGEPNNDYCGGSEDCFQLEDTGLWNDVPCAFIVAAIYVLLAVGNKFYQRSRLQYCSL